MLCSYCGGPLNTAGACYYAIASNSTHRLPAEYLARQAEHETTEACTRFADAVSSRLESLMDAARKALAARDDARAERDAAIARAERAERELAAARGALTNAEGDARILAHAYTTDSRPPADVVTRALSYDWVRVTYRWQP